MAEHKISWLNMPGYKPETWNPIVGCTKVSPGCDHCFAERMAFRIAQMQLKNYGTNRLHYTEVSKITSIGWTGETRLVKEALTKPLQWKSPRMVFTVDMGDLFHESVPFEWIDSIFSIMSDLDQHIYVILTKRPEVVLEFFCWKILRSGYNWRPKDNIWFGVTAENQEQANKRIPILLKIPAAKRFVSIEPMLGPVDLSISHLGHQIYDPLRGIYEIYGEKGPKLDWIICGGETGSKARPMHPDWVRSVRNQCASANVPFFFKQWGEWAQIISAHAINKNEIVLNPDGRQMITTANAQAVVLKRVGRKAAGDLLDGQEYHEWPKNLPYSDPDSYRDYRNLQTEGNLPR